jgi:thiol:disulfide interchange protein DsbC
MKQQMKTILFALLSLTLLVVNSANADEKAIRESIEKSFPTLKIESVKKSKAKGLYEVFAGSSVIYVSEDGKYLIEGHLFDIAAKKDLTEASLDGIRKQALKGISEDTMIVFKPEESKYKVTIFTDIDCGYCRKLHSEIEQYMAEGITVQYLFYPRAGKGSESYTKAISVWCADDRKEALTAAKKGGSPETKSCDNPVDEHMQLGVDFKVRGTPMIVSEDGKVFPGYVPAKKLAQALAN